MKKNKAIWIIYSIVICIGIYLLYTILEREKESYKNAPKINYSSEVNLEVKTISFERNGLFLNEEEYNANGISGYSRFKYLNTFTELNAITPPFTLMKEKNNDTLKVYKEDNEFYLLVREEIEYRMNGGKGY